MRLNELSKDLRMCLLKLKKGFDDGQSYTGLAVRVGTYISVADALDQTTMKAATSCKKKQEEDT